MENLLFLAMSRAGEMQFGMKVVGLYRRSGIHVFGFPMIDPVQPNIELLLDLRRLRINDARAMRWRRLMADTQRNNTEMQALYCCFGFRFIGPYLKSATAAPAPELAASLV